MTYALLASTFGGASSGSSAWPLIGQTLFALGALILVGVVIALLRFPESPARYAGSRRR